MEQSHYEIIKKLLEKKVEFDEKFDNDNSSHAYPLTEIILKLKTSDIIKLSEGNTKVFQFISEGKGKENIRVILEIEENCLEDLEFITEQFENES